MRIVILDLAAPLGTTIVVKGMSHLALVGLCKPKLGQDTPCQQQAGRICGRVVGQTNLETIPGQLVAVCRCHNDITSHCCVGDLACDVLSREADHKAIFGRIIPEATPDAAIRM